MPEVPEVTRALTKEVMPKEPAELLRDAFAAR